MYDLLPDRLPWYVVGPGLGFILVSLFVIANQPLGASGAYVQTSLFLRRRGAVAAWRVWYFVGMALGGFIVSQVLREGAEVRSGYDALRAVFPLGVVVPMVFAGATLLGYGAAVAGGCTSGHGLCGTSQRSPASAAVTATFMTTAIITTFVLRVVTGGDL
ncbi:MAG: YeeE/YedE family protein [Acidimicrobiales bacterium]|nr:YeeE/YedE family protein [Acidimicrobiales bacterium]